MNNTMRTLNRADCAVLHLVLKKKWYDMIASGEKKEEYRDAKPYWDGRLESWLDRGTRGSLVIEFSCGYTKPTMWFRLEQLICPSYPFHEPHPDWGEPDAPHYVIRLGERVVLK